MAQQKKEKKTVKYRLSLLDAQTHEKLWEMRFTKTGFLVTAVSAVVLFALTIFCITAFTPVRTFIPGYPDAHSKRAAILNAMRIDSLEAVVKTWHLYSENLRRVIDGQQPLRIDSLIDSRRNSGKATMSDGIPGRQDSILRQTVLDEEQFGLSEAGRRDLSIEGMHFFTPLKGVISQGYDPIVHPFIDITAPANSVVAAVLDGTVIFAGWNDEAGYTIQIQHSNDIVSTYKHNQKLLKKTGDKVSAGTPVAMVGNTGSLSSGEHLHFELWYRGEAVDPTKYINF
ncbi:MAG: M23 family metallopeptidase [Bacteroidetes bacterium]|uniref:M23 family metallopeptidase n=1 Tax=Candidatus Cryptobacteroides gallistercoris TaxID=2840765 RepID=A0A940IH64_9BACT|nr:M23 family metallopeptidase [Candidatus Cryptobacteroides gallistercoris]